MLLLVSWWNKNSKENVRHGNAICLTEGKSINARSKSAVREGILKNSETVKEDGSVKAADGFQTWDNRQIWTTDTAVQIFQTGDRNQAGELTVQSESQDKVIAPGTSGAYTFFLQNTGKTKMDYKVWLKAGWDMKALKSPLELRLAGERGWLVGSQDGWSSPEQMDRFLQEGSLLSGEKKKYILYWRWAYERGKDEEDTFFGNKAEDTLHTIVIHTEAAQSISGNTGDGKPEKKSSKNSEHSQNSEQTEHRNSVKTADHMSPGSWLTALVFTAPVITMCLILMWFRKRRSYDKKQ